MARKSNSGCRRQFVVLIIVFVLFLLGMFIGGGLFFRSVSSTPKLKSNTYLTWNISNVSEYRETQLFQFQRPLSMDTLRAILKSASEDDRVNGLVMNLSSQSISRANAEEISDMIKEFKSNGKSLYVYAEYFSLGNYYLASLADKVFMARTKNSRLSFTGFAAYQPYMKAMLDKLGINMQIIHVGEYKGAGENLNRETMSDEIKEDYRFILGGFFDTIVSDIARNRELDEEKFRQDILSGDLLFINSEKAMELGLVDELAYYREIKDIISDGNDINYYNISQYSPKFTRATKKIAVVYAEGEIRTGKSSNQFSPFGGYTKVLGSDTVVSQFQDILKDDSILGVVFRINSPGGSALASQFMHDAILEVKEKKPVIVSMSSIAASGGYYIAAPADKIVVQPSTLTGSIGVVSMIPDMSGAYEKMGINWDGFHEGKYSDFGSLHRPMNNEEIDIFRSLSNDIYVEFKTVVSKGRNIPMDELEVLARGRVYTGLQAIEVGLADETGGLDRAIELLKIELGIPLDEKVLIVQYPKEKTFFELMQEGSFITRIVNGLINNNSEMEIYHRFINDFANWVERSFYYNKNTNPLMLYTGPGPDALIDIAH